MCFGSIWWISNLLFSPFWAVQPAKSTIQAFQFVGFSQFFNPGNVVLAAKYHQFSIFLHFKHDLFLSFIRSYAHVWSIVRCIQSCVLVHFTSRFAAFSLAFWCRLRCVLVHLALRFGVFSIVFCMKQPKKLYKKRFNLSESRFVNFCKKTHFAGKLNLRENRIFAYE